jgi:membrane-associated progesterone receptor component
VACNAGRAVEALIQAGADTLLHHVGEELLQYPYMELAELAEHDGGGEADGPYVAVLGIVYDMSASANFYGPGGNYAMFAGRDATLNLARNSLDGDLPGADKENIDSAFQHVKYCFITRGVGVLNHASV